MFVVYLFGFYTSAINNTKENWSIKKIIIEYDRKMNEKLCSDLNNKFLFSLLLISFPRIEPVF